MIVDGGEEGREGRGGNQAARSKAVLGRDGEGGGVREGRGWGTASCSLIGGDACDVMQSIVAAAQRWSYCLDGVVVKCPSRDREARGSIPCFSRLSHTGDFSSSTQLPALVD